MAMTYTTILDRVRQWSNRDAEALPNIVIQEGLRWSADTAYRELQTPPLEYTQEYVLLATNTAIDLTLEPENVQQVEISPDLGLVGIINANLPIPADLTTFIQIRIIGGARIDPDLPHGNDEDGNPYPTRFLKTGDFLNVGLPGRRAGIVFNEKTDIRTFYDANSPKVSPFYWSRQQNHIVIAGRLAAGDIIEVLYYRRLPALDARYKLETTDFDMDTFLPINSFVSDTSYNMASRDLFINSGEEPSLSEDDFFTSLDPDETDLFYLGIHTDHWLRDQNERILIFGALWQSFDYLGDDAMGQKYAQKYQLEMQEINKEELRRKASGGNTQVHYSSNLI